MIRGPNMAVTGPSMAGATAGYAANSMVSGSPGYDAAVGYGGSMAGGIPVGGARFSTGYGGSMATGGNVATGGGVLATGGGVPLGGTSYSVTGGGAMLPGGAMGTAVYPGAVNTGGPCGCGPGASAGECSGAACGAETMCCEPEGGATGVQWVQVPGGPYSAVTSYQFTGEGTGNYEKRVVTTTYGWRFRRCCIGLCALLLLLPLLYLLLSLLGDEDPVVDPIGVVSTPRPTTAPDVVTGPRKTCLIFGDPHAMTFDGTRADYYTPGEYWIVRSRTVWIQGKYAPTRMTSGLSVTKQVGIGGPFLGGHKLVVGIDFITWDGASIQQGFENLGFTWNVGTPPVNIVYNSQGTIMQDSRAGKALHVVHLTLPLGVKIEVNRWSQPNEGQYINLRIMMPAQPDQDGHCGNFNGSPADDKRTAVRARVGKRGVPEGQLIFPGPKTPINPSGRPDLNDCPEGELKVAMERCKRSEHKLFPSNACIIDTCLGHLAPRAM
mmetsp:Transcript_29618/g.93423  ORF Transcript_29618/g.93423 Transcript_29618/m.93423 type:complete len:493 (-) Transcript_29618:259-1737(-)